MLFWLLLTSARAEVVDRVMVDVAGQLVLASEVELEAELVSLDVTPVPFWSSGWRTPLQRMVDAAVVRRVAADVALYQPTPESVSGRIEAVRAAFRTTEAWNEWLSARGLDEARLEVVLKRRIVVERFLLRNLQASPLDEEAWLLESQELLDRLRSQVRIREIPRRGDR